MKTITLYHGSNRMFDSFRIDPELTHNSGILFEGLGVYMTERMEVARDYGDYCYRVHVDSSLILDMSNEKIIYAQIKKLKTEMQKFFANISMSFCITPKQEKHWAKSIINGDNSATQLAKEFCLLIDNSEAFWEQGGEPNEEAWKAVQKLEEEWLSKYIIKYRDKKIGDVYIAKNESLVQNVERISYS